MTIKCEHCKYKDCSGCTCDDWVDILMYETVTTTSDTPIIIHDSLEKAKKYADDCNAGKIDIPKQLHIHLDYIPVLICEGCNKEKNPQNYYDNFVREGKQFVNDLQILLEHLGVFMQASNKELEWIREE
jgi:hypothetical protein